MSAASWALGRTKEDQMREIFRASLDWVVRDAESAAAEARGYQTVQKWRAQMEGRISMAAFGASVIPGVHGAGVVLELPYLFYLMGHGAIGTGELAGAKIEAEADLLAIFALWSGAINKSALAAAEGSVVAVNSVAYPAFGAKVLALGFHIGGKAIAANIGGVAGMAVGYGAGQVGTILQPVFGKVLAKISAKISAKFGAKALFGFVPVFGAAVNVAISLYILDELLKWAELYYQHKVKDAGTL
jgi:hypothetical protein